VTGVYGARLAAVYSKDMVHLFNAISLNQLSQSTSMPSSSLKVMNNRIWTDGKIHQYLLSFQYWLIKHLAQTANHHPSLC